MSARIPSRRAVSTVTRPATCKLPPSASFSTSARPQGPLTRLIRAGQKLKAPLDKVKKPFEKLIPKPPADYSNPIVADLLAKQKLKKKGDRDPKQEKKEEYELQPKPGNLPTKDTLLDPIYELPDYYEGMPESEKELLMQREEERKERAKIDKHMRETAEKLDPDPTRRQLVERQLVIDSIKKRGRLTKAELLARTERQSRFWSIELRTSPKKLTKLMNQIQGKTVEEALVQMRFSKKRAARDVIKGLMEARDTAIVARGMGLGRDEATVPGGTSLAAALAPDEEDVEDIVAALQQGNGEEEADFKARQDKTREAILKARAERLLSPGTYLRPKTGEPTIIELKDGSRKKVYDPTDIYVDRAWIGRGAHIRKSALPRARGQINVLHHRTSHFGVVLKEEKTRMRVSDEIKKKRDNRKLWTALPDRVVTAQRQFCLW